jgi:hypothetical protein
MILLPRSTTRRSALIRRNLCLVWGAEVRRDYGRHVPLQFEPDVTKAGWFAHSSDHWAQLCSIGPHGFAGYARLFHPVEPDADESDPETFWGNLEGNLEKRVLQRLLGVLEHHTGTPDECYFGLWDGFAEIEGSPAVMSFDGQTFPPAFPPEVMTGPRLRIPAREYLLFRGPLTEAGRWGAADLFPGEPREINSPNLMWPADHGWFVATEIDLPWTGIAGSTQLITDLLADEALDIQTVEPSPDLPYWRTDNDPTQAQ